MTDSKWERLAQTAKQRREELGLTQRDTAFAAGLSTNGYRAIEEGSPVRGSTLDAADKALRWAPGSAREVLRGGKPTVLPNNPAESRPVADLPPALRAALGTGEILDVRLKNIGDGVRVVVLGVVERGLTDRALLDAVETFQSYLGNDPA